MNSGEIKRQWLLQNETICICKGIPRKRFMDAIRNGATSLQELNRILGSGSGDCKGERCAPAIKKLLASYRGQNKNGSK